MSNKHHEHHQLIQGCFQHLALTRTWGSFFHCQDLRQRAQQHDPRLFGHFEIVDPFRLLDSDPPLSCLAPEDKRGTSREDELLGAGAQGLQMSAFFWGLLLFHRAASLGTPSYRPVV